MGSVTTAVLYARVSDDRDGRSRSVDQQLEECRAYADAKGWAVVEEITDSDMSASRYSRKSRPGWARVLELAESCEVGALVAWDLDRLLRQPKELEHLIDLADKGLPVVTLGGGDVNLGSSDGRFIARILVAKAAKESDDTSRRVKRAKAARAARGEPVRVEGIRALGWVDGVTVNSAEAALIRDAARRLLDGEVGVTAIAREWNERGLRRPRSARAWSATTVRAVLESPRNAGLVQHQGEVVGVGNWPAIIDRVTYEQVRAMFADPKRRHATRRSTFTGVVRCGRCGGTLHLDLSRHKRVWRCKPSVGSDRCGRLAVTAALVEPLVLDALFEVVDTGRLPASPEADDGAAVAAASELADVERRLVEMAEAFADGAISRSQLLAATGRLETRKEALSNLVGGSARSRTTMRYANSPGSLRAVWEHLTDHERNNILRAVIEGVDIAPSTGGGRIFDPSRVTIQWRT
jgi:DNA invertase Pin-like site-specific DNA recombinase